MVTVLFEVNKETIIEKLDIESFYRKEIPSLKWNNSMWGQGLCLFHEDIKPSFFANKETGNFHCKGCNKRGSIFDFYMGKHAVDFKTALEALAKEAGLTIEPQRNIVIKTYDYVDESGNPLFQTVRYEPKDFKQRRPDDKGGWIYNLQGVRLVPYKLSEVLKAADVIIVEGEKDADNLNAIGITATCNPMGAGKWELKDKQTGAIIKPYNQYFEGKKVVIFSDNDEAGRKHALQVAGNLKGISESVKVIELLGLPEKGDVSDWLAQGHSKEELLALTKTSPEWELSHLSHMYMEGQKEQDNNLKDPRKYFIRIGDILDESIEPHSEIIEGFIPEGSLNLLSAPSTHYKTWLALYVGKCVSEEIPFLGRTTQARKVYYVDKENPRGVIKIYSRKLGITGKTPMDLWPLWAEKEPPVFPNNIYLDIAKEKPLLIFDSQIRFYPKGIDENSASDMNPFMCFLRSLTKAGATVLILHHAGKSETSDYRGSSDILGGVDIAYTIKKSEDDPPVLTLKCIKSRFYQEKDITLEVVSDDDSLRFEIVPDPFTEDLKDIYELLKGEGRPLSQTQVFD